MSRDDEQNPSREEIEERITAQALGEATPAEEDELLCLLEGDPSLASWKARLERTIQLVRETASGAAGESDSAAVKPRLSDERRRELLAAFQKPMLSCSHNQGRDSKRREIPWFVPLAMAAGIVALLSAVLLMDRSSFTNDRTEFSRLDSASFKTVVRQSLRRESGVSPTEAGRSSDYEFGVLQETGADASRPVDRKEPGAAESGSGQLAIRGRSEKEAPLEYSIDNSAVVVKPDTGALEPILSQSFDFDSNGFHEGVKSVVPQFSGTEGGGMGGGGTQAASPRGGLASTTFSGGIGGGGGGGGIGGVASADVNGASANTDSASRVSSADGVDFTNTESLRAFGARGAPMAPAEQRGSAERGNGLERGFEAASQPQDERGEEAVLSSQRVIDESRKREITSKDKQIALGANRNTPLQNRNGQSPTPPPASVSQAQNLFQSLESESRRDHSLRTEIAQVPSGPAGNGRVGFQASTAPSAALGLELAGGITAEAKSEQPEPKSGISTISRMTRDSLGAEIGSVANGVRPEASVKLGDSERSRHAGSRRQENFSYGVPQSLSPSDDASWGFAGERRGLVRTGGTGEAGALELGYALNELPENTTGSKPPNEPAAPSAPGRTPSNQGADDLLPGLSALGRDVYFAQEPAQEKIGMASLGDTVTRTLGEVRALEAQDSARFSVEGVQNKRGGTAKGLVENINKGTSVNGLALSERNAKATVEPEILREHLDRAEAVTPVKPSPKPTERYGLLLSGGAIVAERAPETENNPELSKKLADRVAAAKQRSPQAMAAPEPASPPPEPQPEVLTREDPFSTFSLNVSDVSFKTAEAAFASGVFPEANSVRTEEFVNAFDYHDSEPPPGVPLGFVWDRAQYPFTHNRDILRLSVRTAAVGREEGRPLNLVILLDTSGSMERPDRVATVRAALTVLAGMLQAQDLISVVGFARTPRLWVDGMRGGNPDALLNQLLRLVPDGGTNLEAALELAYEIGGKHFVPGGNNRVILLTDGAANLGNVNPDGLRARVVSFRKQGIALDCFGIGWDGYNDPLLESLSRNGDGRYGFLNKPEEVNGSFAKQLAGALQVAASDVKVQVEFNPERVLSYRQIGYAKHQLKKEQFRDNTVDAAEIGAAESGNALYVIEPDPNGNGPIGVVRVRFKRPSTGEVEEREWPVPYGPTVSLELANSSLRLAVTAAAFGEWLARSPYAVDVRPAKLLTYLSGVPEVFAIDPRPRVLESMIRAAGVISGE